MGTVVGIDLGTTNSVVAILKEGVAKVLPGVDGKVLLPSIVYLGENGELLVGEPALEKALMEPDRTVTHVKREMGTDWSMEWGGRRFTAPMVSSFILRELKRRAETVLGEEVSAAIITVPAYFNDHQRKATKEAGELAGLKVLRLINEPTAATLAYGMSGNSGKVLAFDLGGGTFDVSVLLVEDGVFEVLATRRINQLGGRDFDLAVYDLLLSRYREAHGHDPTADPLAKARLIKAAEQTKEALSSHGASVVDLPFLSAGPSGPIHFRTEVTRSQFEALLLPWLEQLMTSVSEALQDSGLGVDDIDEVVLIGGSTRIPAIQEALEKQFPGRVRKDMNPEECVALGACAQAGVLQGQLTGLVLVDVTPLSLGIETEHDVFVPVIPRNTPLPARANRLFTTIADFQEQVDIHVLQGERLRASRNISLGKFSLRGLSNARAGQVRIEVTFEIDVNGLVRVYAVDQQSGAAETIEIVAGKTLSQEEIAACVEAGEKTRAEDEAYLEQVKLRQAADTLIREARANLGARPKLDAGLRDEVLAAVADLEVALEKGEGTAKEIQTHLQELLSGLDAL